MPRTVLFVILALALMPLSSCGVLRKMLQKRKTPAESRDQTKDMFLGVIESVNPEQKFVLVRMDMRLVVTPGTKLGFRSATGTRGTLMVTPERKLNFLSADITEGAPQVGDIVLLPPQPAMSSAAAAPAPQLTPVVVPADVGTLPPPVP